MTQAQKTAKAQFKQAIAYRQKTGVSLKEAFAHIYGKKVGAVKKKSAPKKKAAKKVLKKKLAKKVAKKKVAKKKLTRIDYDKRYQAKKPGKRKSASGKTYYEKRANRSDTGKLLGIGAFSQETIKKIENQLKDLQALEGKVRTYTIFKNSANYKNPSSQKIINSYIKKAKEQIKETKTHISQLKKHI
jgi:hypothetical protein